MEKFESLFGFIGLYEAFVRSVDNRFSWENSVFPTVRN